MWALYKIRAIVFWGLSAYHYTQCSMHSLETKVVRDLAVLQVYIVCLINSAHCNSSAPWHWHLKYTYSFLIPGRLSDNQGHVTLVLRTQASIFDVEFHTVSWILVVFRLPCFLIANHDWLVIVVSTPPKKWELLGITICSQWKKKCSKPPRRWSIRSNF